MLVLEANSQQRVERGRAIIEPVLGNLVDEPLIEARAVAQLMTCRGKGERGSIHVGYKASPQV